MDSFSLVQVIEKNPELKFKYMGSYPSDKVSQLTKYSVATINTAPINNSGEHWITKARIEKKTYILPILQVEKKIGYFPTKDFKKWSIV